jgi:AraC-like DNA-binding protein
VVARWVASASAAQTCDASTAKDNYVIEINLRPTEVSLTVGGSGIHDGRLAAGSVLLTPAGCAVQAHYRGACDLLHLFLPAPHFETLLLDAGVANASEKFGLAGPDPVVNRLALSLLGTDDLEGVGAQLYAESVASAILARVVGRTGPGREAEAAGTGLVRWRQRRVLAFIDANLSDPIRLPDLARAAGLSRMHFAAQFRAATGVRPHDFVVRRRIERAQEMLRDSALPLAQIALDVGFQTQAHFTTVFRAHVQETPGRWRQLHRTP